MTGRNQTTVSEFLLLGLPIKSEHQNLFYALFLAMYVTTVLGNFHPCPHLPGPHLHSPMYLFLSNLSFSDLCFSSVTMLKTAAEHAEPRPIHPPCWLPDTNGFFLFFGDLRDLLLVAMAYDRYVAICFPCTTPSSWAPGSVSPWCCCPGY